MTRQQPQVCAKTQAAQTPPQVRSCPAPNPQRGGETVLLVEDDDAVRVVMRRALEAYGYTLLEADDGKAALQTCRQTEVAIDLVVTDVAMPEVGGLMLAEQLAVLRPQTKVLFISGYADDVVSPCPHGSFLQKPFTPGALAAKVREVLDRRASEPRTM